MTDERIKKLAAQAGLQPYYDKEFIRFAELVRADEREACWKLCEEIGLKYNGWVCAARIRARSKE